LDLGRGVGLGFRYGLIEAVGYDRAAYARAIIGRYFGGNMRASSIQRHLRPSTIMGRKSTFSSAFASALAPHDNYSEAAVFEAIRDLDQDPNAELECVYCGTEAATWDHVFGRVVKGEFSGHGHRIRNLVPCCRECNESKGSKHWHKFIEIRNPDNKAVRIERMKRFLRDTNVQSINTESMGHEVTAELTQFLAIRSQVFDLMAEADRLAVIIRQKATSSSQTVGQQT
jgi:hypothetical protein